MKNKNATVFGRGENAMRDNADWKKQFGMLIKKDVLILNGQKLVQSMQVHKKLMLQIMPQRIAAHHLLRLFVQLAIDKDQWLIKIE